MSHAKPNFVDGRVQEWWRTNKLALAFSLAVLFVWQSYSQFISRGDFYFPSPTYVVVQTVENADVVIPGLITTITSVLGGFFVALAIGLPVGILLADILTIRQAALPLIVYIYSLPQAIVAPLFILWFGSGKLGVIMFVGIFGTFPIIINTITGFNQLDPEYITLGDQIGVTRWQNIKKIQFWAAVPNIIAGIKIAVQASVIGTIIVEFIATSNGVGYLLQVAGGTARDGMMFGILFLIGVFAITLFKIVDMILDFLLNLLHLE